jgi:hypothetical protein
MDNERALRAAKVREVQAHSVMGTSQYWRNPLFPSFTYTDGVKGVAEAAGAYWLVDAILSHQMDPKVRREPFQVWTLEHHYPAERHLHPIGDQWLLTCTDGDKGHGARVLVIQKIEFSDFPLDEFRMWVEGNVLLLPEEH